MLLFKFKRWGWADQFARFVDEPQCRPKQLNYFLSKVFLELVKNNLVRLYQIPDGWLSKVEMIIWIQNMFCFHEIVILIILPSYMNLERVGGLERNISLLIWLRQELHPNHSRQKPPLQWREKLFSYMSQGSRETNLNVQHQYGRSTSLWTLSNSEIIICKETEVILKCEGFPKNYTGNSQLRKIIFQKSPRFEFWLKKLLLPRCKAFWTIMPKQGRSTFHWSFSAIETFIF